MVITIHKLDGNGVDTVEVFKANAGNLCALEDYETDLEACLNDLAFQLYTKNFDNAVYVGSGFVATMVNEC